MLRVKAKRRVLKLEGVFSGSVEGILVMVGAVALAIFAAMTLVNLGMKSFSLRQENEWLRGRIETLRMEKESVQKRVSEILSELGAMSVDGE